MTTANELQRIFDESLGIQLRLQQKSKARFDIVTLVA